MFDPAKIETLYGVNWMKKSLTHHHLQIDNLGLQKRGYDNKSGSCFMASLRTCIHNKESLWLMDSKQESKQKCMKIGGCKIYVN